MKISISGVCERDMDLFLIEELVADRDLLFWLFGHCGLNEPVLDTISFTHSAVFGNGESDVEIRAALTDGRNAIILVENKVAASFQPRQAERYRERADDYCRNEAAHVSVTLLFAPASYIGGDTHLHGFDVTLSYEELRDWICSREARGARSRYKEMLIRAAIEKSGRGFSTFDSAVSSFQRHYREMVCELEPDLKMNEKKGNPAGSTFIQFRSSSLPRGLSIVHKLHVGYVDLQFTKWGRRENELRTLTASFRDADMTVDNATHSAAIRLCVPPLKVAQAPAGQLAAIKGGILAAGRLQRWVWEHQAELESILRSRP
jgi:hypothetical protein